jgi:sugar (pentulose or hexulose) kinase
MVYNPALRKADPEVLGELDLREDRLPDLLPPTQAAGGLLPEVAAATRLPAGIPVSPAVHDQYASALGGGAIHLGDVMLGTGTAWVLLATTDRPLPPVLDEAIVCTHLIDGLYGQMLSLVNGGSCFSWVLDLLGLRTLKGAQIDEMLGQVSPGSDGLRFWPLLTNGGGAGLPAGTSGRLSGLRLSHKAPHILRSVTEGLALELARCLRMLTQRSVAPQRLVMGGGAAASKVTPQIVADAAGLSVACTSAAELSAVGGAVIARAMVEKTLSLAEVSDQMACQTRRVEPGKDRALYERMLEEYIASLPRPSEGLNHERSATG